MTHKVHPKRQYFSYFKGRFVYFDGTVVNCNKKPLKRIFKSVLQNGLCKTEKLYYLCYLNIAIPNHE
ncbi:hypothetical protein CS059_00905 [Porphyromonas gingivalis]|nr:hypothetical protein CS059_00905 [Porphyromonas gingivalis]